MIFRQLFDRESCTYTYLLGDEATGEAALIDPVRELVDRDMQLIAELGLSLRYTLDTHVHADHVTGSGTLRERVGSKSVVSAASGALCADVSASHGDVIEVGGIRIEVLATPGHTNGCVSYYLPDHDTVFTGDAVMIRGCGRTDFQEGDSAGLYASVHAKLFSLPDPTRIFPGHDYKGRTSSTVAEEKLHNPRLGGGRTVEEFTGIMADLKLSLPSKIHIAVPANQNCGVSVDGGAPGWAPVVRAAGGVPEVSVAWAEANRGKLRLVDVREPDEYTGPLGHVDGAQLVPLGTVPSVADDWDRATPTLVICGSGFRSGKAALTLESLGFERVASMAGGMRVWNESSLPIVQ